MRHVSLFLTDHSKTLTHAKSLSKFTSLVSVDCAWYLENWLWPSLAPAFGGFPFEPDSEGYLTLSLPRWGNTPERVPFIAIAEDLGHIVHGVFLDPARYNGKLVQAVSDIKSFEEVVKVFEEVTGKKARVKYMESVDEMETYGEKGLEDVREMFRFLQRMGGRYFDGGVESESETARELKEAAVKAGGGGEEEMGLTSTEEFFRKHFGGDGK